MQKVLLINPEESRTIWTLSGIIDDEPLDLEMIYTVLKQQNIEVMIFDIQRDKPRKLIDILKDYKPTITYINGVVKQVPFMLEYNELIKKTLKNVTTIVGGNYAEHNYKTFYNKYTDFIVRSYDPYSILQIVNFLSAKIESIQDVNGLCYKENEEWKENKIFPVEINRLPVIDRTFFYEHKEQIKYLDIKPIAHIRTAYSCAYECQFCYRTMLNCGKYTYREIENVVDEINNIDCENIYLIDDDFLIDKERIKKFIKLIKERNIKKRYVSYARVDFIINNIDIIKELKEIGWEYLIVGIESATSRYLEKYNKLIKIEDSEKCISILNDVGIKCMGLMIIDLEFTQNDFKEMYKWIKRVNLQRFGLSIYTPIPGTKLYENYKDRLVTDDLTKWDFIHVVAKPTNISVSKFYFNYYILVMKLFLLAKKYGTYDFIDINKWMKEYTKFLFKH